MLRKYNRNQRRTWTAAFILIAIAALTLSACQESPATPTRDVSLTDVEVSYTGPTLEPYAFKTAEPGTASAHGMLLVLDPMSLVPAPGNSIYLVPIPDAGISTIPHFEVGTVPQAEVNESTGEFMFTNLQAGTYAVVVIAKGQAQIPVRYYQGEGYAIFSVDAADVDTVIELGNLSLP